MPVTAYSYYYLDENAARSLLSQVSSLPPKEMIQSVSAKEDMKANLKKGHEANLTLGVKETSFKFSEMENQETVTSAGRDLSITATYDQTATPSSLAAYLEYLLEENLLVEDFNRRVSELIDNWQKEVRDFSRVARERYSFEGVGPLLTAAEVHM